MKAVVLGATGAVGRVLLDKLLCDDSFSEVRIFVRKAPNLKSEKLCIFEVDFARPSEWADKVGGDVAFIAFGTTLKQAKIRENMRKIDVTYPLEFAKTAKQNGISSLMLLSSVGANALSKNFYLSIKGELENEVQKLGFNTFCTFRPSVLERGKGSDRIAESLGILALKVLNALGVAKKLAPMPIDTLASQMIKAAKIGKSGVFENEQILNGI